MLTSTADNSIRTTLSIDDDVLAAAKVLASRQKNPRRSSVGTGTPVIAPTARFGKIARWRAAASGERQRWPGDA